MVLKKLLSCALIQGDELDCLTNFNNSYLTCVVVFVARQIHKCLSSSIVVSVRER